MDHFMYIQNLKKSGRIKDPARYLGIESSSLILGQVKYCRKLEIGANFYVYLIGCSVS